MTVIKLCGAVSLFAASIICYFELAKREKDQIRQLDAYIKLIQYIKENVEYYLLPINSILRACESSVLRECSGREDIDIKDLNDLYESSLLIVPDEAQKYISDFCASFGKAYKDDQVKLCGDYINKLTDIRDELINEVKNRRKIRFAVTMCAPLFLILLLI